MSEWQDISTAPKDCSNIVLFGTVTSTDQLTFGDKPGVYTGYWDDIDEAWCMSASTFSGPFVTPTHWQPLPEPPLNLSGRRG